MSYKDNYQHRAQEREEFRSMPMSRFFFHQEARYVHPFRIFGNVYYVGDDWVCVHLVDTGDGLLLIDSGNSGASALLIQAIWEAGFKPDDVRWIIHSHGHIDHMGASVFFRNLFGTKLYIGAPDAEMFKEKPEFSFIQDSLYIEDDVFVPDGIIDDGDEMYFGNTKIRFRLVPGHTQGCIALFFDAVEDGVKKRCGYYGGFGFNTMNVHDLDEYGDTEHKTWELYGQSLEKVMDEPVDIFLGNHTENNRTLEKKALIDAGCDSNPFIDPAEWKKYMIQKKAELEEFVRSQKS